MYLPVHLRSQVPHGDYMYILTLELEGVLKIMATCGQCYRLLNIVENKSIEHTCDHGKLKETPYADIAEELNLAKQELNIATQLKDFKTVHTN